MKRFAVTKAINLESVGISLTTKICKSEKSAHVWMVTDFNHELKGNVVSNYIGNPDVADYGTNFATIAKLDAHNSIDWMISPIKFD